MEGVSLNTTSLAGSINKASIEVRVMPYQDSSSTRVVSYRFANFAKNLPQCNILGYRIAERAFRIDASELESRRVEIGALKRVNIPADGAIDTQKPIVHKFEKRRRHLKNAVSIGVEAASFYIDTTGRKPRNRSLSA